MKTVLHVCGLEKATTKKRLPKKKNVDGINTQRRLNVRTLSSPDRALFPVVNVVRVSTCYVQRSMTKKEESSDNQ